MITLNFEFFPNYSIKANKLISGVIPNIAASMAKRIEYGKSVIRNTSRKRKPKRNSNNKNLIFQLTNNQAKKKMERKVALHVSV